MLIRLIYISFNCGQSTANYSHVNLNSLAVNDLKIVNDVLAQINENDK